MTSFRLDLDFYHGPMDLLVVLVHQGEIDVLELAIAQITSFYLDHQNVRGGLDLEDAGEFLILATMLMETKSRILLPHVEPTAPEIEADETHSELVRQLMEYRRFREAAAQLHERALRQQERFGRVAEDLGPNAKDPSLQPIRELELWDLVSAFNRLLRENIVPVAEEIERDPTPLPVHMNRLESMVIAAGASGVRFRELLGTGNTKPQLIGKFLAVLELIKTKRVWVEMEAGGDEILFFPPSESADEPRDESMPMADQSVPPEMRTRHTEPSEDEDESSSMRIHEWNERLQESRPDPDGAWADFEPLDDEEPSGGR